MYHSATACLIALPYVQPHVSYRYRIHRSVRACIERYNMYRSATVCIVALAHAYGRMYRSAHGFATLLSAQLTRRRTKAATNANPHGYVADETGDADAGDHHAINFHWISVKVHRHHADHLSRRAYLYLGIRPSSGLTVLRLAAGSDSRTSAGKRSRKHMCTL